MSEDELDLIEVSARHDAEVEADEAEIRVTVQGSSLVMGNAVFEKAREVQKLVEALRVHGITQAELKLRDVRAEVSTGLLGKSSSATYELSVRCRDLGKLPDVLGEIGAAKQATLGAITWHYPDTAAQRATWLARCVADASTKAQAIAAALPCKLAGVHRIAELDSETPVYATDSMSYGGPPPMSRARAVVALGFELGQRKTITVRITASFRVAQIG